MDSPVSPLVANLFMEYLEQKLTLTRTCGAETQTADDILKVVKKMSVEQLTD